MAYLRYFAKDERGVTTPNYGFRLQFVAQSNVPLENCTFGSKQN